MGGKWLLIENETGMLDIDIDIRDMEDVDNNKV